jgi:predicted RND superfamily exporter protein
MPETFSERAAYERFIAAFGGDYAIVVGWPGCTVDDSRLVRFADALKQSDAATEHKLFTRVVTGHHELRRLTGEPAELKPSEAIDRLRGVLVGVDGRGSCAVAVLAEEDLRRRRDARDRILSVAQTELGLAPDEIHLAGLPIDCMTIDEATTQALVFFAPLSVVLCVVICLTCLRSTTMTAAVMASAVCGEGLVLACMYYTGIQLNAVLVIAPVVVFVLGVSGGVHLANYYDDARASQSRRPVSTAVRNGLAPCLLAALTTAIGVGTLMFSEIVPIRQFGTVVAPIVLVTSGILLLILPGAMVWVDRSRAPNADQHSSRHPVTTIIENAFDRLTEVIRAAPSWFAGIFVALMLVLSVGLVWLDTSFDLRGLFVEGSRALEDYRWMEEHVGGMVSTQIVVHFESDCPLDLTRRIEMLGLMEEELRQLESVRGVISAATFVPRMPQARGIRQTSRRSLMRRRIASQRQHFLDSGLLHANDDASEDWRLNVQLSAFGNHSHPAQMSELQQRVDAVMQRQPVAGISAWYTGHSNVVYGTERVLLNGLFVSFAMALLIIAVVMALVLRSARASLVALIPNLFPSVVVFGFLGWLNMKADIGSIMTASVALGIAVDDTIHFLAWFRRGLAAGRSRAEAVRHAYHHCGQAMIQTTMICGLGLGIFVLSRFLPMQRFAWMMLTLMLMALVGDLLLLPALLMSPLGKWFAVSERQTAARNLLPTPSVLAADKIGFQAALGREESHSDECAESTGLR